MYKLELLKQVRKDFKKIPSQAKEQAFKCFDSLLSNPRLGIPLAGEFKKLFKIKFTCQGISYRIVYKLYPERKIILIIIVGPRENIYKNVKKRII